jgi:hypothetical protein
MEMKQIPYIAYEAAEAKSERTIKRLILALVLSIILIFASHAIWLYAWCQYDYSSEDTVTTVEQDAQDGGDANYIGHNGDINNGLPENNSDKENAPQD